MNSANAFREWSNRGGWLIDWTAVGAFEHGVRVAAEFLPAEQAAGYAALRYKDATGTYPGEGHRATTPSTGQTVLDYLSKNYPPRVLGWVKNATWTLNSAVPLAKIKMGRRPGARDPEKVAGIAKAITAGQTLEPVVLVDTGEGQYEIADGYHRTLAAQQAGKTTISAFIGSGVGQHGPWETEMHAAKLNTGKRALERFADAYSGERYDTSPIGLKHNWVTSVGGLPAFARAVAHALIRNGHTESEAIQLAIGVIKDWAEGKGNVTAKTRAKAAATVAEWEAKKAAAHAERAAGERGFVTEGGTAGVLLPVASKPHLPKRGGARGICGSCGKKVTAKIHNIGRSKRMAGSRHAGPDGHHHVRTGHTSGARRIVSKQVNAHAERLEPAAEKAMKGVFAQQRKATVDRLNGNRGKAMIRSAQEGTRAPGDDDGTTDDQSPAPLMDAAQVFDMAHWVPKTKAALEPLYGAVQALSADRLAKFGSTPAADNAVVAALEARGSALAQTVSQTTFDQIQEALKQAIVNGDTIGQMTAAVNSIFDDADRTRAQMIARTEVIGAMNTAADTQAKALGSDVIAGKEWIATHDDRTRPTHREADGQIQSINVPFIVGATPMTQPGDPAAPPDEVINCRCTAGYLTPAEYARRSGVQVPHSVPVAA